MIKNKVGQAIVQILAVKRFVRLAVPVATLRAKNWIFRVHGVPAFLMQ
jgi:hypothetical protein